MLIGFADGGRGAFGGWIMDPEPLALDAAGHLVLAPQPDNSR
ncbi:hypothetical protein [Mangrovicoccus ximenensis]|nr:hypothetical protein [Mangrovicoccus ximenensis]